MNDLPEGWSKVKIGNLAVTQSGGTPSTAKKEYWERGTVPWLNSGGLKDTIVRQPSKYITELGLAESSAKLFPRKTVLIALTGATTGETGLLDFDCSTNQSVTGIFPSEAYIPDYLFYFLQSARKKILENAIGSAQPHINKRIVDETDVPLAPLNEQKRIVEKLEKLLGRVEAVQARLDKIPAILKRFRQSVLAAACSGKLTADWRFDGFNNSNDLPATWRTARFESFLKSIRGGSTAVPQNEQTGFPILRSSSVRPGYVDLEDVKYLSPADSLNELNYIAEGDLLFTRLSGSIEYVANCAQVRGLNGKRIQYPDRLFCAKLAPTIDSKYCEFVFAAPSIRAQITERAKSSAGHQRVSITDIKSQEIPVPPVEEQKEIVRRVEELFKFSDQVEERYRKARSYTDKLTQSILAKAFRGELVPQDPNDEPASALLERIRNNGNPPKRKTTGKASYR